MNTMDMLLTWIVRATFATAALSATVVAKAQFYVEAGVSFVGLADGRFERTPDAFFSDDGEEAAPFIAGGYSFSERFGMRASYHYIGDIKASAGYGHPPGMPDPVLPVVVYGHYKDDVHLVGLAPELRWAATEKLKLTFSPMLNWVASRGVARYAYGATPPTTLLAPIPNRRHRDEGLTFGASIGMAWMIGERSTLSLSYQYTDLEPSWDRVAHLVSGALRWNF